METYVGRYAEAYGYTLEQFRALENFKPEEPFTSVVLVPMDYEHDSGYLCMKFVLLNEEQKIVGVVGGGSDVVNLNGIGGYGWHMQYFDNPRCFGWSIDCLPKSQCMRLFCGRPLHLDDWIGSDFGIYA